MQFAIDDHFVRFGSTRYAINKITSFRVETKRTKIQGDNNRFALIALGVMSGLFSLLSLGDGSSRGIVLGILGFALCGWLVWKASKIDAGRSTIGWIFSLHLMTSAGEQVAFETNSKTEMDQIEVALERAMQNVR